METFGIIYAHINKLNSKVYVGQTCQDTKRRWRNGGGGTNYNSYKSCTVFYNALNKYTWANFETIELCSCKNQEDLDLMEEYFIKYYKSLAPEGYNSLDRAGSKVIYTPEVRAKISAARTGQKTGLPSWNHKFHTEKDGVLGKECSSCKEWKPLEQYSLNKRARVDGLMYVCRKCNNDRNKLRQDTHKKLDKEELAQSYIDRTAKMAASVKARFDSDPTYKAKISAARSKAIIATNIETGEVLEFVSALEAKAQGYHNVSIGRAIKESKPYKGFTWRFK